MALEGPRDQSNSLDNQLAIICNRAIDARVREGSKVAGMENFLSEIEQFLQKNLYELSEGNLQDIVKIGVDAGVAKRFKDIILVDIKKRHPDAKIVPSISDPLRVVVLFTYKIGYPKMQRGIQETLLRCKPTV